MSDRPENMLRQHIKDRTFSPVYLLYGAEQKYTKNFTDRLVKAVVGKNPNDFDYHVFSGDINLDELGLALQNIPMFSEYNCVTVTDIFLDSMEKNELDTFKKLAAKTYDGTIFIISMPSYVPVKTKAYFDKLSSQISKLGTVCRFDKLNRIQIEKYISKWCGKNGKIISQINASKIIEYLGDDLNLIQNETNKLCAYVDGEEITIDDIELLINKTLEAKTYAMAEDVAAGRADRAFQKLDALFYNREDPVNILYALTSTYIDAYRMRTADECGVLKNEVASDFEYKNRSFALDKAKRTTRQVSTDALRNSLCAIIKADEKLKSTPLEKRYVIEQLIAHLLLISKEGAK